MICIVVITKWPGNVTSMGDRRSTYRILVKNPEGKRLLGKTRRGWENVIKNVSSRN
jgi:hypothetical protein